MTKPVVELVVFAQGLLFMPLKAFPKDRDPEHRFFTGLLILTLCFLAKLVSIALKVCLPLCQGG